ncbi:hypothetical protein GGX14DRAFT_531039 [Mycena pura]|uniref:Uncharacterized protein n=1 Tax=Mycena pura TaxID=153505 RepID=A0AAD6YRR7_9AGAR|nr:hypothetical protein GGX14DRAFT_531039 [Mycena pura]
MASNQNPAEKEKDEFKQKSLLELDATGYWQYIDGPDYSPPLIPVLKPQGLDGTKVTVTITIPGNEGAVAAARKQAEVWLLVDKRAHAIIVKAVLVEKLYVVRDCKSAHDAWIALKNEYEPANTLTAVTIKQQIIGYQCGTHDDPVRWRQVMVQLYQKLRDADPPLASSTILQRLKHEEVEMRIAPSIVSINALVVGKGKKHPQKRQG